MLHGIAMDRASRRRVRRSSLAGADDAARLATATPARVEAVPLPRRASPSAALFAPVLSARPALPARWRFGWNLLSTVVQAAAVVALTTLAGPLVDREQPLVVPVKIVRTAPPATRPGPPPPPAPAAVKPRPADAPPPRPARKVAPTALIQPRELPLELKVPDPTEPPEEVEYGDGQGDGVVGGIPGGARIVEMPSPPAAPAPVPRGPVKYQSHMTPPQLVIAPPLEYTQEALEHEVEGTMVVECVVEVDGTVHGCKVLRGLPYLDRAAVANLERRRYRPATLGGQPLAVSYTFTLRFRLP